MGRRSPAGSAIGRGQRPGRPRWPAGVGGKRSAGPATSGPAGGRGAGRGGGARRRGVHGTHACGGRGDERRARAVARRAGEAGAGGDGETCRAGTKRKRRPWPHRRCREAGRRGVMAPTMERRGRERRGRGIPATARSQTGRQRCGGVGDAAGWSRVASLATWTARRGDATRTSGIGAPGSSSRSSTGRGGRRHAGEVPASGSSDYGPGRSDGEEDEEVLRRSRGGTRRRRCARRRQGVEWRRRRGWGEQEDEERDRARGMPRSRSGWGGKGESSGGRVGVTG